MLATLLAAGRRRGHHRRGDLLHRSGRGARRIGYVAQGGGTTDEVTAREELVLQARMYGIGKADAEQRAAAALDAFELAEYADRQCKTYSGGQRRRVDIALGVIHSPKVLFLDEPTAGLDPQSRAHMWDEVRRLRDEGMTVFLTTHYLDEADALCDRIAIIDHGEIVAEGTPDALKREISGDVVTVGVNGADPAGGRAARRPAVHSRLEVRDEGGLRLHVDAGETAIPQIMRALDGPASSSARSSCTGPRWTTCS